MGLPKDCKLQREYRFPEGQVELYHLDNIQFLYMDLDTLSKRADTGYWNLRWAELYDELQKCPYPKRKLGEFIPDKVERGGEKTPGITYGQVGKREYPPVGTTIQERNGEVVLQLPGRAKIEKEGVLYLQVRNLRRTGADPYESPPEKRFIEEGSHNDLSRSRIAPGDLLIVNSGIGSIGRCAVMTEQFPFKKVNISQDISRLVLRGIYPEWCAVYLQTKWGAHQIIRFAAGVSGQIKIIFDEIRSIVVVVPPEEVQQTFAQGYRRMTEYHWQMLEAKRSNNRTEQQRAQHIALAMLEALIWQAEELIDQRREKPLPMMPDGLSESMRRLFEDEYERIGQMVEQQDLRPHLPALESRPLGIPLERDPRVVEELERLMRWVHGIQGVSHAAG